MGQTPALASGARSHGGTGFKARYHDIALRWERARERRRQVAQYTRELNGYTDRELGELGIDRLDIPAVARGTYRPR